MPKVSIIVPTHNTGKYLVPMMNSIICQTFKDIEIIIIDDGSTDGTREKLKRFESMDNRITVIFRDKSSKERFGQKYSADLGRSLAKGEYIMLLDHDDQLYPDSVEKLYAYTNNGEIDVVQGRYKQVDDTGKVLYKTPDIWSKPVVVSDLDNLTEEQLMLHLAYAPIAVWACLIRNEFQKDIELSDCIYNDTDFIWKLKIRAKTFCYIPDEVYLYNTYENSTSGSAHSNEIVYDIFTILDYLNEFLKKEKVSNKIWNIYYVFKYYTLYKMNAGLNPQTKLEYYKAVSKKIHYDPNIATYLLMFNVDQNLPIIYSLLR